MRKLIITILIIIIMIFLGVALLKIPAVKDMFATITGIVISNELEEYNNEFEINKLKVKNQTFYYDNLSDTNKQIYTCIANGVKNFDKRFALKGYNIIDIDTTMKDIEDSMQAFFADHPEVFYVNNQYTVSTKKTFFNSYVEIELKYTVDSKSDLDRQINELEGKINEYLQVAEGKTGFDAELELHDRVGTSTEYYNYSNLEEVPQDCHTIYGTLIKNKAVCDGFSKTFQILLDRKGVENIIVLGNLENESHAWNLVKIEDDWYHVDLTSSKAIKDADIKIVLHTYFNLTTEQIEKTHKIDNKDILPVANSKKYNYYKCTGKSISVADNFNTKFKKLLDTNTNKYLLEFSTEGLKNVPEKMVDFLSQNKYNDYISNNKITYYTMADSCVLMKKQ